MTLHTGKQLSLPCGECSKRYALIDLHMIADRRRLADDDSRTMIDTEIFADRRARIDVDTGQSVCILRHDTRNIRYI